MTAALLFLGVILFIFIFIMLVAVSIYNGLVRLRNDTENSFSQIDVQLKRRHDLIPNLVETAKKFMSHERETLEAVIQARNQAVQIQKSQASGSGTTDGREGLLAAETMLTGAVGKFFALSESYPELKSDGPMRSLMEELSSTENKISFARQRYNDSVMEYNNGREQFPNNILAGMFNFQKINSWVIENTVERDVVKVQF